MGEKRGLRLNHLLLNETLHEKLKSASVDREERGKALLSALDQKRSFSPGQSNDHFAPIADIRSALFDSYRVKRMVKPAALGHLRDQRTR